MILNSQPTDQPRDDEDHLEEGRRVGEGDLEQSEGSGSGQGWNIDMVRILPSTFIILLVWGGKWVVYFLMMLKQRKKKNSWAVHTSEVFFLSRH